MSFVKHLGNAQHLRDLKEFKKTLLVLVYSDTCKPCQRLKPVLFKKVQDAKLDLYIIKRAHDENVNVELGIGKIPHVSIIREGELHGGIQNSDIEVTWPYVEACLADFTLDEDF